MAGAISGSPAVMGQTVYVADQGGFVHSINADGKVNWKVRLGGPCVGGIAADERGCYLGAQDRFFYALNAKDGSVRAKVQLNGQGYRLLWPVIFKDRLIVQTVGAICVGCEGVMDDVLASGNKRAGGVAECAAMVRRRQQRREVALGRAGMAASVCSGCGRLEGALHRAGRSDRRLWHAGRAACDRQPGPRRALVADEVSPRSQRRGADSGRVSGWTSLPWTWRRASEFPSTTAN